MDSKQRMQCALSGEGRPDMVPVAPHWWGLYKFEVAGADYRKDAWRSGTFIAEIYAAFYEKFKPDWFHLHHGTPASWEHCEVVSRGGKRYLAVPSLLQGRIISSHYPIRVTKEMLRATGGYLEIHDDLDQLLAVDLARERLELRSLTAVEEHVEKHLHFSEEEIIGEGFMDHVSAISSRYGDSVFIAVHHGSPFCFISEPSHGSLGFEGALIAFREQPLLMRHLLDKAYEKHLEWAKAAAKSGAHGFAISEQFVAADICSPRIYRDFFRSVHRDYFFEIRKMGLKAILCMFGDINPLLDDLTGINIDALMIEESRKGYLLDPVSIKARLGERLCLFGNVDTVEVLLRGTVEDVKKTVEEQLKAAVDQRFVVSNGSPIALGTREENVRAFIDFSREQAEKLSKKEVSQ